MTKDEALDLALEALEGVVKNCWRDIPSWRLDEIKERITAIKQARSAPVQEPVAIPEYIRDAAKHLHENRFEPSFMVRAIVGWINGSPPAAQRQWVGLTDDERTEIRREHYARTLPLMDAIEAKLKEKNT
jgi:hypothetical protein